MIVQIVARRSTTPRRSLRSLGTGRPYLPLLAGFCLLGLVSTLVPTVSARLGDSRGLAASQASAATCPVAGISPGSGIMWESDADLARDLDEMVSVGAQWVRLDFGWAALEPSRGSYDWSHTDRVLNAVSARGLKVVALLHATPAWARAPGTDNIFYPPTDPADYANFAGKTVERYSGKVKVWEVMNEPNISVFWQPKPDVAAYTKLLKLAYSAIKKADPGATVLSAGLSPAVNAPDGSEVAPGTFLQGIYQGGGKGSFDAVGVHPYSYPKRPIDPTTEEYNTFQRLPIFYDLMVRNGDGDKKMWLTEYGAPTGTAMYAVSEAEQAAMVTAAFSAASQMPGVGGPLFIYSVRDAGTNPDDREDNFGLLRRDFSPKPAREAYRRSAAACIQSQPATLSISDATVAEGKSGTNTPSTFTITRSGDTTGASSVRYETVSGSAVGGNDFVAVGPTTVNFAAGETSKAVTVTVNGDTGAAGVEEDETFTVKLSSPTGATISDDTGLGTILNDDSPPTFSINDVAVVEGNSGTTTATFTITRSGITTRGSALQYSTSAGTATAGSDFAAVAATVVQFADGETSKTVSVTINGDLNVEPTETFSVKLFAPFATTIADDTGLATIFNDDGPSTFLSVDDVSVSEGLLGATATFTITRSGVTTGTSSVRYATANGTATAGADYTAVGPATLSFAAGETTKTVAVPILPDLANEPNETVLLNLSAPVGAVLTDAGGVATIVDDDLLLGVLETPGPTTFLAITDASLTEGNSGTTNATFTIVRSGIVNLDASSVQFATAAGTATAGGDFVSVGPTTVNFAAAETVKTVTVAVNGDTVVESAETFSVKLSSPSGAVISDDTGLATIFDDDILPTIAVGDASVTEGASGTVAATFTITRSGPTGASSSVQYATAAGTAAAGSDFVAIGATTVTFAAGETAKTVTVAVNGDTTAEGVETFSVKLSSPTTALIADDTGIGTIFDDDALPTVAVSDVVTPVSDQDSWAIFSVTRLGDISGASSVKYATAAGTATEGTHFTGIAPTTLTFAEQEKIKIVTVKVKAQATSDETFSLNLSTPTGTAIADGQAAARIVPVPAKPTSPPVNSSAAEDAVWVAATGVTIDGNDLTKTAPTGWGNSGAVSRQAIRTGNGFVQFTATETSNRMIGLSNGNSDNNYPDIDFALFVTTTSRLAVYEKGISRGTFGLYAPGDALSVVVEAGTVTYRRNGVQLYKSTAAPVYPLVIDTALYSANATLRDVVISGELDSFSREDVVWVAGTGVTINGNDLTKTAPTEWGNSGAVSRQAIRTGDGLVQFTATETSNRMIGLSNGNAGDNYPDIDFALFVTTTSRIAVYEKGISRGTFGLYAPGDALSVVVETGTVTYRQNGVQLYKSTATPVYPLLIDTALYSANATLRDVVISGQLAG